MADLPTSLPMLEKLIGFETTSARSNLELIDFIANYFDKFGIKARLIYDETKQKANLLAEIGPTDRPGIVLSGHTDTVPVADQNWSGDPFRLRQIDGKLIGRGSTDMKGFIASVLATVPEIVKKRERLSAPIYFAFTYDEEVGCKGAPKLVAQLAEMAVKPKFCIIGEPTLMRLVNGHKGRTSVRCAVHGQESHSAHCDHGVNSIEYATRLILYIRQLMDNRRESGPILNEFDPPFTTLHTGVINGGTALNIVPKLCQFEFETRTLPCENGLDIIKQIQQFAAEKLIPEMRKVNPDANIIFEILTHVPGLSTDPNSQSGAEIVSFIHELLNNTIAESKLNLGNINDYKNNYKVSYGTEGGVYQSFAIPTIICGPGSINEAHRADEWINSEQIIACEEFLMQFLHKVST